MGTWKDTFGVDAPAIPNGMLDVFRRHLQDFRKRNRLLGGEEELTDDDLTVALRFSLDDWNSTTPVSGNDFESHPSVQLLFLKGAVEAHRMAGQIQSRNQLTYTDGGINVAVSDKTALDQSWMNQALSEYEVKKRQLKNQINLEQMYGQCWSEYSQISGRTDVGDGL